MGPSPSSNTGLDHLGLVASSREEFEAWKRRFDEHGVSYTPIRDTETGHHLNFRDPDGIALEFGAPTDLAMKAQRVLASRTDGYEDSAALRRPASRSSHGVVDSVERV